MTTSVAPRTTRTGPLRTALLTALPAWIVARVLVAAAYLAARYWQQGGHVDDPLARVTVHQGLLAWDGAYYADLAQHGYAPLTREALRFFPLTPLAGRALGWVGTGPRIGVVIVANLAALAAGALLVLLVRREGMDAATATRAAWLLALAPSAFVLVLGYAEGLFLALAIAILLAARTRRWWVVVVLGALAGLDRPGGFLVLVPIAVEAARGFRTAPGRERIARVAAGIAPVAGAALYLAWVADRFGDAFLPYRVQTHAHLKGSFANPVTSIGHALEGLFEGHLGTGLHVPWMIVVAALVVVCFRRLPASYGWFAVVSVASSVTSDNLDSFERYALGAFPVVIAAASVLTDRRWARATIVLSGLVMTGYATLAFLHAYVP